MLIWKAWIILKRWLCWGAPSSWICYCRNCSATSTGRISHIGLLYVQLHCTVCAVYILQLHWHCTVCAVHILQYTAHFVKCTFYSYTAQRTFKWPSMQRSGIGIYAGRVTWNYDNSFFESSLGQVYTMRTVQQL